MNNKHCIDENIKLSRAFDLYKDSAEDKQAELKGELVKVNMQNGKLRQKAKAWFATSVILFAVVCLQHV